MVPHLSVAATTSENLLAQGPAQVAGAACCTVPAGPATRARSLLLGVEPRLNVVVIASCGIDEPRNDRRFHSGVLTVGKDGILRCH